MSGFDSPVAAIAHNGLGGYEMVMNVSGLVKAARKMVEREYTQRPERAATYLVGLTDMVQTMVDNGFITDASARVVRSAIHDEQYMAQHGEYK
jgi:hypothetical protein